MRLQPRGKPYWRQLEPGLAIGYRKPTSGAGKWVVSHHLGGKHDYETDTFGVADDLSDPDGEKILSFWQAQTKAREAILKEFRSAVLTRVPDRRQFVNEVLVPYADAFQAVSRAAYQADEGAGEVNDLLRALGLLENIDWIPPAMSYFKRRLAQAPRDAGFALDYVKAHARTPEERASVCNALIFKTNVLWVQLDALYHAYVEGHIPPGAFVPKEN